MIPLITEKLLTEYSSKLFLQMLCELLQKTSKIDDSEVYARQYCDDNGIKFVWSKRNSYAKQSPLSDVKQDIHNFTVDLITEIRSNKDKYHIESIQPNTSIYFGISEYIYITFTRPIMDTSKIKSDRIRRSLESYVERNKKKYVNVEARISDHKPVTKDKDHYHLGTDGDSNYLYFDIVGKTFEEASEIIKYEILKHVEKLKQDEEKYVQERIEARRRKLNKQNRRLKIDDEQQEQSPSATNDTFDMETDDA